MANYAILRHRKIKEGRHLAALGRHNARTERTPNAVDGGRVPRVLIGSANPGRDVMALLRTRGVVGDGRKLRKDANVAVEIVAAASPEWWGLAGWRKGMTVDDLDAMSRLRLEQWIGTTRDWLKERHGDRMVSLMLHLDEATPHLHAVVVPISFGRDGREKGGEDRWRLSVDRVLGGPRGLAQAHTSYAERMGPLGLVRGEERAETGRRQHKPLATWQAEMADELAHREDVTARAVEEARAARIEAERSEVVRAQTLDGLRIVAEQAEEDGRRAKEAAEEARRDAQRAADVLAGVEARERAVAAREAAVTAKETTVRALGERQKERAAAIVAQGRANEVERGRLATIAAELGAAMAPILDMARRWVEARPVTRQAMGRQGEIAAEVAASPEVGVLAGLAKRIGIGR